MVTSNQTWYQHGYYGMPVQHDGTNMVTILVKHDNMVTIPV